MVVPVFAGVGDDDSLEDAIKSEKFEAVVDVLNSLQEHDEELVDIIRELKERKGAGEPFNPRRLTEKIEVIGPRVDLERLTKSICVECVDGIGSSWDEMLGRLLLFKSNNGTCLVPRSYGDQKLAKWVSHQRNFARNNSLGEDRIRRLRDIGFNFDPYDTQWLERFESLKLFYDANKHSNVPSRYQDRELARWIVKQRVAFRNHKLEEWKKEKLGTLDFQFSRTELDRRNREYLDFEAACSTVRSLGLTSLNQYFAWARGELKIPIKFPNDLPRPPQNVYCGEGWTSWNDFLGTQEKDAQADIIWEEMFLKYQEYVRTHNARRIKRGIAGALSIIG